MSSDEQDRYQWTFDTATGEPIGVLDTWYSPQGAEGVQVGQPVVHQPPQVPAVYQPPQPVQVFQPAPQVYSPPQAYYRPQPHYYQRPRIRVGGQGGSRAVLYIAAGIFATGFYLGFLLFGGRTQPQPVVLVCTQASSYPFAPAQGSAAPASCAPAPQGGAR
jgi:hypothetical protein